MDYFEIDGVQCQVGDTIQMFCDVPIDAAIIDDPENDEDGFEGWCRAVVKCVHTRPGGDIPHMCVVVQGDTKDEDEEYTCGGAGCEGSWRVDNQSYHYKTRMETQKTSNPFLLSVLEDIRDA